MTAGIGKNKKEQVRLDYSNGVLAITGPGANAGVHASGTWPRTVRADAGLLKKLAPRLPNDSRVLTGGSSTDDAFLNNYLYAGTGSDTLVGGSKSESGSVKPTTSFSRISVLAIVSWAEVTPTMCSRRSAPPTLKRL